MKKQEFKRKLCHYVQEICKASNIEVEIVADTLLFKDRLINSIRIIDIIAFVEQELNIKIPDEKLRMDYFRTPLEIAEAFCEKE